MIYNKEELRNYLFNNLIKFYKNSSLYDSKIKTMDKRFSENIDSKSYKELIKIYNEAIILKMIKPIKIKKEKQIKVGYKELDKKDHFNRYIELVSALECWQKLYNRPLKSKCRDLGDIDEDVDILVKKINQVIEMNLLPFIFPQKKR